MHKIDARPFERMAHPGRLYAVYEPREGYDCDKARRAYVRLHGQEPEQVIWARPGFWLAGPVPVPEPVYLVGVEAWPAAEPEPEIETTPLTVVGQLGLF